jgi:hypothetical protein
MCQSPVIVETVSMPAWFGDVNQLPSVGAGQVLRDLLDADPVPRVRLTRIFRQAAESGVVAIARRLPPAASDPRT